MFTVCLEKGIPLCTPHPIRDFHGIHVALFIHHNPSSLGSSNWAIYMVSCSLDKSSVTFFQQRRKGRGKASLLLPLPLLAVVSPPFLPSPYHFYFTSACHVGSLLLPILCSPPLVPALRSPEDYALLYVMRQLCVGTQEWKRQPQLISSAQNTFLTCSEAAIHKAFGQWSSRNWSPESSSCPQ